MRFVTLMNSANAGSTTYLMPSSSAMAFAVSIARENGDVTMHATFSKRSRLARSFACRRPSLDSGGSCGYCELPTHVRSS